MYSILSENLSKKYHAPILSRSFYITSICYVMAFVIPLMILISIDYSISENKKALLKPIIKYENYQLACLMKDLTYRYDSSFSSDEGISQTSTVSVGTDANSYSISANIWGDTLACTILTYNRVVLNQNTQIVTTMPFSFYQNSESTSTFLQTISQMGKIEVIYPSELLEPTVKFSQNQYHTYGESSQRVLSIEKAPIQFGERNLTAIVEVAYRNQVYGASSTGVTTFEGKFEIESEIFLQSSSLLDKAREFVPYFIYLWLSLTLFVIQPILNWMLENRIYSSRWEGIKKLKID